MKRSGFTMIELVFVIVILGILAAVAIPKLMATRDDAKIAAKSTAIQNTLQEIQAYATSQGNIESNITLMSNSASAMVQTGDANENPELTLAVYDKTDADDNYITCITIKLQADSDGNVADSNMTVLHTGAGGGSLICDGILARVPENTTGTLLLGRSAKF